MGPPPQPPIRRPARDDYSAQQNVRFPKTLDLKFDSEGTAEAQLKAHVLQEYQHNAHLVAQVFADNMSSSSESSSQQDSDEEIEDESAAIKAQQELASKTLSMETWQNEYNVIL